MAVDWSALMEPLTTMRAAGVDERVRMAVKERTPNYRLLAVEQPACNVPALVPGSAIRC